MCKLNPLNAFTVGIIFRGNIRSELIALPVIMSSRVSHDYLLRDVSCIVQFVFLIVSKMRGLL